MEKDIKLDALQEVFNIGTGQAANALSALMSQKVLINIPSINLVPIEKVTEHLGGSKELIVGVYFQIVGDLGGRIMLLFNQENAHKMASMLVGDPDIHEIKLSDVNMSSIMEMGNIIANSYLNALAGLLDMKLYPSIPYFAEDMLGAVVDFLLIELAEVADQALLINTEMEMESENIKGSFLVFPDDVFLTKIYDKLGIS
jgi:chemotaxis protein CheC